MKTDHRTKYTRKVICDSFLEILETTPIQRITVKAICEKADINRSTFYRYYKDPYDLLDQLMEELWESLLQEISETSRKTVKQGLEDMFLAIKNERIHYITLLSVNTGTDYYQQMTNRSFEILKSGFQNRRPGLSEIQLRWMYTYITQGILAVVVDWYQRGMSESPKEMACFTTELVQCVLEHHFQDAE